MDQQYNHHVVERNAQKFWEENQTFNVSQDNQKEKYYCLSMLPYPSGNLHMGHVRNYTLSDVMARTKRMLGKNVLHPIGWDAFGLPAENAAIKNKVAPAKWTYANIDHMRASFKSMGMAFDWSREFATCDKNYYHWEQWLFTRMVKKGLAYQNKSIVNWDPVDNTVLANEQVVNGRGWRSGALIERREVTQWFFKITAYADELLQELDHLPGWPDPVKTMQRNWIGKSSGADVFFNIKNSDEIIETYTTRADTLMAVNFIALSANHKIAKGLAEKNSEIQKFCEDCQHVPVAEEAIAKMEKLGINTGLVAINPISGEEVPIWICNYVISEYGTGAVMGVPSIDERDQEFAKKYNIVIKEAELFDPEDIINKLEKNNHGRAQTKYRLRDWGVSRQRYWGTPIPIIYCDSCGPVTVPDKDLPVVLPENVEFTGADSPLKHMPEFYNAKCPECGKDAKRETDTFDTFVQSSWYYARYTCPTENNQMLNKEANYWLPVDQYIGGIEHAVMHLLYARFYHKVMRDEGLVSSNEPFTNLLTQGMVLKDGVKMSKSKGNVVDPKELIDTYGADTARLFSMFAAPPELSLEWNDAGVDGCYKFLKRLWNLVYTTLFDKNIAALDINNLNQKQKDLRFKTHSMLKKATYDMQTRHTFNTAIAGCMELLNNISKFNIDDNNQQDLAVIREALEIIILILSPITPHICHYMWQILGKDKIIVDTPWPIIDEKALVQSSVEIVVQVNGKVRAKISVDNNLDNASIEKIALADDNIQKFIDNKSIKKIIVVPNKLVNIVAI